MQTVPSPRFDIDHPTFVGLFLDEQILGPAYALQNRTFFLNVADDPAFPRHQGIRAGQVIWQTTDYSSAIFNLFDMRWAFPTAEQARRYHLDSLEKRAEGFPPLGPFTLAGENGQGFGGIRGLDVPDAQGRPIHVRQAFYNILFQIDRVAIKLFAGSNLLDRIPQAPVVEDLFPYTQLIEKQVKSALEKN